METHLNTEVKKLSEIGAEITYQIPLDVSEKFKEFFDSFDTKSKDLGIESYGISITTLEEVFLRVGSDQELKKQEAKKLKLIEDVMNNSRMNASTGFARRFSSKKFITKTEPIVQSFDDVNEFKEGGESRLIFDGGEHEQEGNVL